MKFLLDIIMPPLKNSKHITEVTNTNDNNHYLVNLTNTNDNNNKYNNSKYPPKVLKNLNNLRKNSRFCDVEIIAGGEIIKVTINYSYAT